MKPVSSAMGMNRRGATSPEAGMAPPDQGLEALQPVVGEGDDGLVLEEELGPSQCPPEAVGQIEPLEHAGPHRRLEHLDPVLPLLLGFVHGRVRFAEELLGRLVRLRRRPRRR